MPGPPHQRGPDQWSGPSLIPPGRVRPGRRSLHLVEVRQDAQRRWYRLRPAPLAEIDAWLEPYRDLWRSRLDALEAHLDRMSDGPDR